MKLRQKFSIIILLTVVEIILLTVVSLFGSNKMQEMKNYQFIQASSETELSELINYLNRLDSWGFDPSTINDEWDEMVAELDVSFKNLETSSILSSFPESFKKNLKVLMNNWYSFKTRFTEIGGFLKQIQSTELDEDIKQFVIKQGVHTTYEYFSEDPNLILVNSYVNCIHEVTLNIWEDEILLKESNTLCGEQIVKQIQSAEALFRFVTILFAVVSCVILSIVMFILTGNVSKRIIHVRDMTQTLADKDFTVSIDPNGSTEMVSLMNNINNMVDEINDFFVVVKKTASKAISSGYAINDSANSTASATNEIDANIKKIKQEFDMIGNAVMNSRSSIHHMNEHVTTLVENNKIQTRAIEDSNKSFGEAVETLGYINEMSMERCKSAEEMHEFVADGDEKISQTAKMLNDISSQVDEIRDVVTIINTVANQTNLLSMNAAIESAHAGEAGKGFSVVAEEIRKLAEETANNAKKIKIVVANIVTSVANANKSSQAASEAFTKVSVHADQVVNSLHEITDGIKKIDGQMQFIMQKSSETGVAADKINSFCEDLAKRQNDVSEEIRNISNLFDATRAGINKIKKETGDIVTKMRDVSDNSKESYKNMTDLENVLEKFKTKSNVDEAVRETDEENAIETVISPELEKSFESDDVQHSDSKDVDTLISELDSVPDESLS